MIIIACVDAKNGIGKDGKLLISIPKDMEFFRETTKDNIVIMGRKTLFSFKNKMPLKNRLNIVFTSDENLKNDYKDIDNIFFVKNLDELDALLNKLHDKYKEKKDFVIGGASIYNELIDRCDTCLITKLNKEFQADTFFPVLEDHGFSISEESDEYTYDDIKFKFLTYRKNMR